MSINMNKEYRAELRTLIKARNKLFKDLEKLRRTCERQIEMGERATDKATLRVNRRIKILEGRLS